MNMEKSKVYFTDLCINVSFFRNCLSLIQYFFQKTPQILICHNSNKRDQQEDQLDSALHIITAPDII